MDERDAIEKIYFDTLDQLDKMKQKGTTMTTLAELAANGGGHVLQATKPTAERIDLLMDALREEITTAVMADKQVADFAFHRVTDAIANLLWACQRERHELECEGII